MYPSLCLHLQKSHKLRVRPGEHFTVSVSVTRKQLEEHCASRKHTAGPWEIDTAPLEHGITLL